jgi:hypothetical protein
MDPIETSAENTSGTENAPVATPAPEVVAPDTGATQSPQGSSQNMEVEPGGATENIQNEYHSTRAERRIQQLSGRVRDNEINQQPAQLPDLPELSSHQTEVESFEQTPEDILANGGEMSAEDLQGLIANGVDAQLNERENVQAYEQAMQTFENDIVSLTTEHPELDPDSDVYNPELDNMLTELITQANVLPDGTVHPRTLPSELYARMTSVMSAERQAGTEKASLRLADQASEQAVPTGAASVPANKQYTAQEENELRTSNPREYNRQVRAGVIN